MKFSAYQHWDPLKLCVVGCSYPPEFYSWIDNVRVRSLFEKIAIETEEDFQNIIKKLHEFNVEVLRPVVPTDTFINGRHLPPPMTPRDNMIMVGEKFYQTYSLNFSVFYQTVRDPSWPDCHSMDQITELPVYIQNELREINQLDKLHNFFNSYQHIFDRIQSQGNKVINHYGNNYNECKGAFESPGAYITRVGRDLYFGTNTYTQDNTEYLQRLNKEFPHTRNHIVNTGGHSDGTYCPVTPGLIISLQDVTTYADTFPGWEVVYLPGQSWDKVQEFLKLKKKNKGRWWIPGFENDQDVIDTVEQWLNHWTGYVEETVFDVNMLIIDPKNVMVFNYNKQVFDALNRYGITPHIVPFRHRYFWDGGIHCVTSDIHRVGTMQDYFPERNR
jgi:N-dimethylarginine dimethylaminohydrolase